MSLFFRRLFGALALDAGAFEEIEADPRAGMHSVIVVMCACAAGGVSALALGLTGVGGFVGGMLMTLGGWLVWVACIAAFGTITFAEPQTRSSVEELLRVLGFAAAPALFLAFAAIPPAASLVLPLVAVWMIAAAVIGVRQALDYRHTARAAAVCSVAFTLAAGMVAAIALLMSQPVS